jgi:hypothetical protein
MPRSSRYHSRAAIGQPKRHVYRSPATAKEYRPEMILRAQFAAAARPKRISGGRRRVAKPRYRPRPKSSKPKR